MEFANIYSKSYSSISDTLQNSRTINYDLVKSRFGNKNFYGIHITSCNKGDFFEDMVMNISSDKNFVLDILKYFYENAVDIMNFKDVLNDIFYIAKDVCKD